MSGGPIQRPGSTVRCGTPSGYRLHQHHDEKPCDACTRAKQEYDERWRSAPERVKKSRASAKAQARAYSRLAHMFPDAYAALYEEEKTAAYREAGLQPEAVRSW